MFPGLINSTFTPRLRSSSCNARARKRVYALLAAYTACQGIGDLEAAEPDRRVDLALDMMADTLEANAVLLREILEHNPANGPLFASMRVFITERSRDLMRTCVDRDCYSLPAELVADHYANTLMLVLDWAYLRGHTIARSEMHDYVHALLGQGRCAPPTPQIEGHGGGGEVR